MSQEFRGINDFYFVKKNKREQEAQPVDTEEDAAAQEEESPEVKLIEGKWLPGDEGFLKSFFSSLNVPFVYINIEGSDK